MNKYDDSPEEVVEVIEQKDARARLFIGVAALAGLLLGALLGTIYAQNKWQAVIHHYQEQSAHLNNEYQLLIESVKTEKQEAQRSLDAYKVQVAQQAERESAEHVSELSKQSLQLEQVNEGLQNDLANLKQQFVTKQQQFEEIQRKLDLQTTLFDRARELFKKEEQLKQLLEDLLAQQMQLSPQAEKLNKECNLYLEGKSWETRSDVCERHDDINAQMGRNEQMIAIHQLDLKEIEALTEELGL